MKNNLSTEIDSLLCAKLKCWVSLDFGVFKYTENVKFTVLTEFVFSSFAQLNLRAILYHF